MQIGCGVYELTIRNRPYLYFWHYESKGGRRVQVKEYVGPARSPDARVEAGRWCEAYFDRAAADLVRLRKATVTSALLAGLRYGHLTLARATARDKSAPTIRLGPRDRPHAGPHPR